MASKVEGNGWLTKIKCSSPITKGLNGYKKQTQLAYQANR